MLIFRLPPPPCDNLKICGELIAKVSSYYYAVPTLQVTCWFMTLIHFCSILDILGILPACRRRNEYFKRESGSSTDMVTAINLQTLDSPRSSLNSRLKQNAMPCSSPWNSQLVTLSTFGNAQLEGLLRPRSYGCMHMRNWPMFLAKI